VELVNNININSNHIDSTLSAPSPPTIIDTRATGHFFKVPIDLDDVTPTHTGNLQIPGLLQSYQLAHVYPNLASNSLMSITQLCAHGRKALFTNTAVTITLYNIVVLTGTRSTAIYGCWTLETPPAISHSVTHPTPPQRRHHWIRQCNVPHNPHTQQQRQQVCPLPCELILTRPIQMVYRH
jgi:hypothetical protein